MGLYSALNWLKNISTVQDVNDDSAGAIYPDMFIDGFEKLTGRKPVGQIHGHVNGNCTLLFLGDDANNGVEAGFAMDIGDDLVNSTGDSRLFKYSNQLSSFYYQQKGYVRLGVVRNTQTGKKLTIITSRNIKSVLEISLVIDNGKTAPLFRAKVPYQDVER